MILHLTPVRPLGCCWIVRDRGTLEARFCEIPTRPGRKFCVIHPGKQALPAGDLEAA